MLKGNMLIAQGGGPTPVINSSLLGAVREAKRHPEAIENHLRRALRRGGHPRRRPH